MTSLRAQITLGAALLAALTVALSGLVIAVRIDYQDRAQLDRALRAQAAKVQADVGKSGATLLPRNDRLDPLAATDTATRVLDGGRIVAASGQPLPVGTPHAGLSTVELAGQNWRSLVETSRGGQLQVLQSLAPVEQRLHDNARLIALVALVATLVSALAAWLLSGFVLRPLERLRQGAATVRLDERLPTVGGQREIAELTATLNAMLERLERSMDATRRFTADAGHELRTPLAALGMDLETLAKGPPSDEMVAAMQHEYTRMAALLDGLQQLARGDAEVLPTRSTVDLATIADMAVNAARRRHPGTTYTLDTTPASLEGWPDGLRLALDNLLDNAAVHGQGAGTVHVTVDAGRIIVDDDGPGIDPADRRRLVERFARGHNPRSAGSGLGLALADQQARLHGGSLVLSESPLGGLRATITIALDR